jgi:hypothetical protein
LNFGNKKNDDISKYKRNLSREKERQKERKNQSKKRTDGWMDDKPQTTNRRQTERQNPSKVLGSLKFQEQTSRLEIWDTN